MVISTTILLAIGALTLSVMLILTIAYLWIYLGHYNNITVGLKPTHAPHTDKAIAYKEFDGDFDEIPTKYNEVLAEYPDHISFGIYDDYEIDKFEGKYKIGVFIKGKKELKKGFKLGKMISSKAAICSQFAYTDAIQIRVGLKNCTQKMNLFASENKLQIKTFVEVYESNCAFYSYILTDKTE